MQDFIKLFFVKPSLKSGLYIIVFAFFYFVLGALGLEIQSEQYGVSPFWPSSGLTLAAFFIFGFWLWPGVVLGLLFLAFYIDIPILIALVSSFLSILESALPLIIARKFNFNGRLDSFHDGLIFAAIVVFSPMLTAVLGAFVFYFAHSVSNVPLFNIMLIWWLGNSLGMLLLGGTLLSFYSKKQSPYFWTKINEKIAFVLSIIFIFLVAFTQSQPLEAALMVNLLIPVIFFSALRFGTCGPAFLSFLFVVMMSLFTAYSQREYNQTIHSDFQYLILVKIWFVCISGILIAGAFKDKSLQSRLKWMATHDDLTSLNNRVSMEEEIGHSLKGARSTDTDVSLLFLDMDHFKPINDQLGHKRGDEILKEVSNVLLSSVRQNDIVSRWGGDEFVILLQQCSSKQAKEIANKILEDIVVLSFVENKTNYPVSMSIGIASAILGETALSLIERSDAACYEAKNNGKNQSVIA